MVSMEEGDFLSIKCMAPDSFPHRTVQWSKEINGEKQPVRSSSHLTISETKDLHFAFLKTSDSGVYICTVTNLFILSERKSVERQVSLFVTPGKNIKEGNIFFDISPFTVLGKQFVGFSFFN